MRASGFSPCERNGHILIGMISMDSLTDAIKLELQRMSTSDLQGILAQGSRGMLDFIRGLAPPGHPEELIRLNAAEMTADIKNELARRGGA